MSVVAQTLNVSRSNRHDRLRKSAEPRRRYHKAQDAAVVPLITALVTARPTYGYRRITAVLNRQLRAEGWTSPGLVESGLTGDLPFELGGADEVERRVALDGIVEAVDVAADGLPGLGLGLEDGAPDQLGLQRLEEGLDHGVVEAVSLPGHRDQDAMPLELGLVVDRAVLAALDALLFVKLRCGSG